MKVTSFLVILLQFTLLLNSTVVVAQYARANYVDKCREFKRKCSRMMQDPTKCKESRDKEVESNDKH